MTGQSSLNEEPGFLIFLTLGLTNARLKRGFLAAAEFFIRVEMTEWYLMWGIWWARSTIYPLRSTYQTEYNSGGSSGFEFCEIFSTFAAKIRKFQPEIQVFLDNEFTMSSNASWILIAHKKSLCFVPTIQEASISLPWKISV